MSAALPTLARVSHMRTVRERRRVLDAVAALRSAERMLEQADRRRRATEVSAGRAEIELHERPQCEQRRFLLAARIEQLRRAEELLCEAQLMRDEAEAALRAARLREQRAELREEVIDGRLARLRRRASELSAEREAEDRWTSLRTA